MRRSALTGTVVAALAVTLAACSGGPAPEAGPRPGTTTRSTVTADVTGELTWWDTSDPLRQAPAYKKLVAEFTRLHPGVRIDYQSVPAREARARFEAAAAAGSGAPDVLRADLAWVPGLAAQGFLYDLDGTGLSQDDVLPAAAGSTTYNGKAYGVAQDVDSLALLTNRKLLAKAYVQPPTTWAELKTAAATVRSRTGQDGAYLSPTGYDLLPFVYGEGGDLVDVATRKITVSSPAVVAGITQAQALVRSPGFVRPTVTPAAAMSAFARGRLAMVIQGSSAIPPITAAKGFGGLANLGIDPVPAGSKRAAAPLGGHDLVVWSGMSQDKAAAATAFIAFMTSAQAQARLADQLGVLPTRPSAYAMVKNPVGAAFQPVLRAAVAPPWVPENAALLGPLDAMATATVVKGGKVNTALDAVAKAYQSGVLTGYTGTTP